MTAPTPTDPAPAYTPAEDVRGRPLWYDLMTTDAQAAKSFYTTVTDWQIVPFDMGGGISYDMWGAPSGPIGGSMTIPKAETDRGTPPHWLAYFGTPDVHASYARALALGAKSFVAPTDIPTVGTYAVIADPQGARFALYTPANAPMAEAASTVGQISWHELATDGRESAWSFYSELLGWAETSRMDMGPMGIYQMFGRDGFRYGGMMDRTPDMPPPNWLLYIHVGHLDAALDRVRTAGGQVLRGPMDVPDNRVAICLDPQGVAFALQAKA